MRHFSIMCASPAVLLLCLGSCKTTKGKGENNELKSEISGLSDQVATLGTGYESETETTKSKCISGPVTQQGAQTSNVTYSQDLDFSSLTKIYTGGAKVGVKLAIFNVNGAADFASKEAVDEYSSSISILNEIKYKKDAINYPYLTSTSFIYENGKVLDTVRTECGDEYVQAVEAGGSLFVNAKFNFKTKEDKLEFKGNASVSLANVGEIGGQISHLSESIKKNSKVTITARQIGGDGSKLSSILSTSILTCSLADFEKSCKPMLENIIKYGGKDGDFQKGFANASTTARNDGAGEVRFLTRPFRDESIYLESADAFIAKDVAETENAIGEIAELEKKNVPANETASQKEARLDKLAKKPQLEEKLALLRSKVNKDAKKIKLVPPVETSMLNSNIDSARIELYLAMQKMVKDRQRVSMLLQNFDLTDFEREEVEQIETYIERNSGYLETASKNCVQFPSKCIDSYNSFLKNETKYKSLKIFGQTCLQTSDLVNTKWRMSRSNNSVVGEIELLPNGKLGKYKSQFEDSWKVQNCQLRIINIFGVHSTIFDSIESVDRMTGTFIQDPTFRHVFERIK